MKQIQINFQNLSSLPNIVAAWQINVEFYTPMCEFLTVYCTAQILLYIDSAQNVIESTTILYSKYYGCGECLAFVRRRFGLIILFHG